MVLQGGTVGSPRQGGGRSPCLGTGWGRGQVAYGPLPHEQNEDACENITFPRTTYVVRNISCRLEIEL